MSGWMAWAAAAGAALEAYEADYGERLPDDHELGRIEESGGSPSFRIRAGHIRQLAAAPDLAAAAIVALERMPQPMDDLDMSASAQAYRSVRAALLKARGE